MYEIRYRNEDDMKASGIEWLEKVPSEWNVLNIGNIGRLSTSSVNKKTEKNEKEVNLLNYLDIYNSKTKTISNDIDFMRVTAKQGQLKSAQIEVGDVYFTPSSETIEDIGHSAVVIEEIKNTLFSYHIVRLTFSRNINKGFKKYMLNNYIVLNQFSKKANGTTRKTLNIKDFKYTNILLPLEDEQEKIADFLDIKISQFDSIISKKEHLVEKLEEAKKSLISEVVTGKVKIVDGELVGRKSYEMKGCGVQWLGKIPNDWMIAQFKRYIKINSGREILDESKDIEKSINVYGSGGIFKKTSNTLHKGKAVLFGRKGTIGKPIYVNEEFWTVDTMYFCTCNKEFLHKLLYYQLLVVPWNLISTQTALPSIVGSDIGNLITVIPILKEQYVITNFLDSKIERINSVITKTKLQIQKLKQAKQSLISEAVTGKIDLRDWDIKEI